MEKSPNFLREFSMITAPEERKKTAEAIHAARKEHFEKKKREERTQKSAETTPEISKEAQEQIHALEAMAHEIDGLSSIPQEIDQMLEIQSLRFQIDAEHAASKEATPGLRRAKEMIDQFYASQAKRWENAPYSKEDAEKYVTEKQLSKLSENEFSLLLRRFPDEMLTHVTRQGIRDHTGFMWHQAGIGEYRSGFMEMAKDGRMLSPLGVCVKHRGMDGTVEKYLKLSSCKTREEAIKNLNNFIKPEAQDSGSMNNYTDPAAIHLTTEAVADVYYGSEEGNEVFVAFPSLLIANEFNFSGTLNVSSSEPSRNDQFIWTREQQGIDLDAGLVFLPENTPVDPRTGSRYAIDRENKPVKNTEYIGQIETFMNAVDIDTWDKDVMDAYSKERTSDSRRWETLGADGLWGQYEPLRQTLKENGIHDWQVQKLLVGYNKAMELKFAKGKLQSGLFDQAGYDREVEGILRENKLLYKKPESTVPARKFWENYFEQHPDARPSKVVYYSENSPSRALHAWKERKGLIKTSDERNMGFPEHQVGRGSQEALTGSNRFRDIAMDVIDKQFPELPLDPADFGLPPDPNDLNPPPDPADFELPPDPDDLNLPPKN